MRSLLSIFQKPEPVAKRLEQELRIKVDEVTAKWQQAVQIAASQAFQAGYQTGHAAGELAGRQALAHELQVAHGVEDGGERPMTTDEVMNLSKKQLH